MDEDENKLRKKIIWLKERPRIRVSTTVKYEGRKSREYCIKTMYIGKRRTTRFRRKTQKKVQENEDWRWRVHKRKVEGAEV